MQSTVRTRSFLISVNKLILQLLITLSLAFLSCSLSADLLLGASAPGFHGQDLQGRLHRLSDYKGKIVVLEWSSPECPYSRRYYGNGTLDALYDYADKNGIVWINIVPRLHKLTAGEAEKQFHRSKKIVILDQDLEISTAYSASTTPQIFIIDRQGILAYSGAIDSTAMFKQTNHKVIPYTRNALVDLVAGKEVDKKITRAYGCFVKSKVMIEDGIPPISASGSQ